MHTDDRGPHQPDSAALSTGRQNIWWLLLLLGPGRGAVYCDQTVCLCVCVSVSLSVCPRAYLWNRWTDHHEISCADSLWLWLGHPPAELRYVMHFRFYGWRHVWPHSASQSRLRARRGVARQGRSLMFMNALLLLLLLAGHVTLIAVSMCMTSACPSVCNVGELWSHSATHCGYFDTTRNGSHSIVFWHQQWLTRDAPFRLIFALKALFVNLRPSHVTDMRYLEPNVSFYLKS